MKQKTQANDDSFFCKNVEQITGIDRTYYIIYNYVIYSIITVFAKLMHITYK